MADLSPRPVAMPPGALLDVPRLDTSSSFAKEAYAALKRAICAMDIYSVPHEIRLDERRLSEGLGVSRTPIREAMTLLEQEGFVRTRPRRGIFVVKKSKREIVEMITVMAALEGMAARLAAERATAANLAELHRLMDAFRQGNDGERLDDYSDANIAFHQAIIRISGCALLSEMTENLFIHMRAIRKITIHQENRAVRSIVDHFGIGWADQETPATALLHLVVQAGQRFVAVAGCLFHGALDGGHVVDGAFFGDGESDVGMSHDESS